MHERFRKCRSAPPSSARQSGRWGGRTSVGVKSSNLLIVIYCHLLVQNQEFSMRHAVIIRKYKWH